MELDRFTTQETQIKNDHEEFEFEKNDGYTSDKSRQTLSEKETHLESIKASLKRLEDEIERYTKLSKKVRKALLKHNKPYIRNNLILLWLKSVLKHNNRQ